jgi:hypothetical protein
VRRQRVLDADALERHPAALRLARGPQTLQNRGMPTVLALGLDPSFVDLSGLGFNADQIRAFIDSELGRLQAAGYEVVSCLVDLGDTAESVLAQALALREFDCIMIGAGLRAPERLLLFERLLNLVHAAAPDARICFNTSPRDSTEAVQRWV